MSAKILVVDDSQTVRQQVANALQPHGFEILEAVDGVQGAVAIGEGGIDCVICDVNMPNMDGISMVEKVKAEMGFTNLPIIMLTTEGAMELVQRAKKAGASGWIVKPFKKDLLLAAVTKLTSRQTAS